MKILVIQNKKLKLSKKKFKHYRVLRRYDKNGIQIYWDIPTDADSFRGCTYNIVFISADLLPTKRNEMLYEVIRPCIIVSNGIMVTDFTEDKIKNFLESL